MNPHPFTNPETGLSKAAQEALTRNLAPSRAKALLAAAQQTGEITPQDIKANRHQIDPLSNLEPEMRERIQQAFSSHEQLFARIGHELPTPADFAQERPDVYLALAEAYTSLEAAGQEPAIVISPLDLPQQELVVLAENLTSDPTIPHNPLKAQNDGHGLWLSDWYQEHYQELQDQAKDYLEQLGATITRQDGLDYTLSVLPATDQPQDLGKTYNDIDGQTCTADQYQTLQFVRVQQGLPPLDQKNSTWLHGRLDDLSPRGNFGPDLGQVSAYDGGSGNRYSVRGRRLPGVV